MARPANTRAITEQRPRDWRRCLGCPREHLFLTTPDVRLCPVARGRIADIDPVFGSPGVRPGVIPLGRPASGLGAAMMEA